MIKITVGIDGMACGMCEAHINEAARNAFPVKSDQFAHKERNCHSGTVCVSLKALAEEGYILMDDAYEVHLTEKGMQIAKEK